MKKSFHPYLSALLLAALGTQFSFSQIPEKDLESIFSRLNGEDYDARHAARMDLQAFAAQSSTPESSAQETAAVEAQLLERLESEPLLTTKIWILRQLEAIGGSASKAPLESLSKGEDPILADAARMTLETIGLRAKAEPAKSAVAGLNKSQLKKTLTNTKNPSVRFEAYQQIEELSPKLAASALNTADDNALLHLAAESDDSKLKAATRKILNSGETAKIHVVLGTLQAPEDSQFEDQVRELARSENEALQIQALEALGRIGSVKSLDTLLELIQARSRDLRDEAIETLARINDSAIDDTLFEMSRGEELSSRLLALEALSYRASDGVSELMNDFASDNSLEPELRKQAIESMELVGTVESLPILVDLIVNGDETGLRKPAQKTLKRMTLRIEDPDAAWSAFEKAFEANAENEDVLLALLLVVDSAPSKEAISYLEGLWTGASPKVQSQLLRVLPNWRNWDGGYALLNIAANAGEDSSLRMKCFKGIGRLILGSDAGFNFDRKFALTAESLQKATSPEEREAVINGYRYCTWRERVYVSYNEVDPELREAVLKFAIN